MSGVNTVFGTVLSADDRHIVVAIEPTAGCSACAAGAGCGLGPLLRLFAGNGRRTIRLPDRSGPPPRVGQRVRVAIPSGTLALYALLAYGVPLFGLVAGAVIATTLWSDGGDVVAIAGALFGAASGWIVLGRSHPALGRSWARVSLEP